MSFHQIEDFVEDAIRLVYSAQYSREEKRDLVYNLYHFQNYFDTSYTHFRVKDLLKDIGYLYEWPIEKHPDFKTQPDYFGPLNPNETHWIPVSLHSKREGSVFIQSMESQTYLYFDAGDKFWERVKNQLADKDQEAPQAFSMPTLFFKLLHLGSQANDQDFFAQCYACFVYGILEFYFETQEGIPEKFEAWLTDKTLIQIRKLVQRHQDALELLAEEDDELFSLPDWEDEIELAKGPEEQAKVHFLLHVQYPLSSIKKTYLKERNKKENPDYYELAYSFFYDRLGKTWAPGIREFYNEDYQFSFCKKIKEETLAEEAVYATLIVQLDKQALQCKMGIQNGLILQWQKRNADPKPEYQHFIQDLMLYPQEGEIQNNKFIGSLGEWKYAYKKSTKWLSDCLESVWGYYQKYSPPVYEFYAQPLALWGKMKPKEGMKKRADALEKCMNFFGNEMDFKLALAYWNHRQGNVQEASEYLAQVEDIFSTGLGSSQLRARIKQGMASMKGEERVYPEISTLFSGRLY